MKVVTDALQAAQDALEQLEESPEVIDQLAHARDLLSSRPFAAWTGPADMGGCVAAMQDMRQRLGGSTSSASAMVVVSVSECTNGDGDVALVVDYWPVAELIRHHLEIQG